MKSIILILALLAVSTCQTAGEQHNHQHTFLVKTDLTKEQVENLLKQYYENKNQETTQLHASNHEKSKTRAPTTTKNRNPRST